MLSALGRRAVAAGYRGFSTASEAFDVVIVGGGMVGMSLAAALGALPCHVPWATLRHFRRCCGASRFLMPALAA